MANITNSSSLLEGLIKSRSSRDNRPWIFNFSYELKHANAENNWSRLTTTAGPLVAPLSAITVDQTQCARQPLIRRKSLSTYNQTGC